MPTRTVFLSSEKSKVNTEMECFVNDRDEILITIFDSENVYDEKTILLDKKTSIKFSKHLRKQIACLIESEVKDEKSN